MKRETPHRKIEVPLGAASVQTHYPGFIDISPGCNFLVVHEDLKAVVTIQSHKRPLIVTDFGNYLTEGKHDRRGRTRARIKRPIQKVSDNSISATATGSEGGPNILIAVERRRDGRIFFNGMYTEIHVIWEVVAPNRPEDLRPASKLLERFISLYRYHSSDTRIRIMDGRPLDPSPWRTGYVPYGAEALRKPWHQRLSEVKFPDLPISLISFKEAARALRDHETSDEIRGQRERAIGSWLIGGYGLSENLLEIERIADLAFIDGRFRSAVVEAMSILEISILQARSRHSRRTTLNQKQEIGWKEIKNKILPEILSSYEIEVDDVCRSIARSIDIRHSAVHGAYQPSIDEAAFVLSTARILISTLELPEKVKGFSKCKA